MTSYWRAWLSYGVPLPATARLLLPAGPFGQRLAGLARPAGCTSRGHVDRQAALPGALGAPGVAAFWLRAASPPTAVEYLSWPCRARRRRELRVPDASLAAWCCWRLGRRGDIVPAAIVGFGTLPPPRLAPRPVPVDATRCSPVLGLAFLRWPTRRPRTSPSRRRSRPGADRRLDAVPARRAPFPARSGPLRWWPSGFAAGAVVSGQAFVTASQAAATRSYIATARLASATAPRGTVIVDGPTPATVMNSASFRPAGYTSRVIGAMGGPARATAGRSPLTRDRGPDDVRRPRPAAAVAVLGRPAVRAVPGGDEAGHPSAQRLAVPVAVDRAAVLLRSGGLLAVSFGGTPNQVSLRRPPRRLRSVVGDGSTVSLQFAAAPPRLLRHERHSRLAPPELAAGPSRPRRARLGRP